MEANQEKTPEQRTQELIQRLDRKANILLNIAGVIIMIIAIILIDHYVR